MQQEINSADRWPLIAGLVQTLAQSKDPHAVWVQAEAIFGRLIGHQLFTVLGYDESAGEVIRLYSSQPEQYPVSGTKPMGPTPWGELVLKQGQIYIGSDASDIEWAFPDHALIAAMGLQSALNLPIRVAGTTLGTVNLLHGAHFYDHAPLQLGSVLAALLAPVLLASRNER